MLAQDALHDDAELGPDGLSSGPVDRRIGANRLDELPCNQGESRLEEQLVGGVVVRRLRASRWATNDEHF